MRALFGVIMIAMLLVGFVGAVAGQAWSLWLLIPITAGLFYAEFSR